MDTGQVGGKRLLAAGGDLSPLLEAVAAPLGGVALLVTPTVDDVKASASTASSQPVRVLIRPERGDRSGTTAPQVLSNCAGRAGLVRQDHVGPGARPASTAGNAQARRRLGESRSLAGLSAGQAERQPPAAAVGREVDLCAQSSAGPADGVVSRLACRVPLFAGPGSVPVHTEDRGVHRPALMVQADEEGARPAVDGPPPEPVVDASPVAVLLRQVDPPRSGPKREGAGGITYR